MVRWPEGRCLFCWLYGKVQCVFLGVTVDAGWCGSWNSSHRNIILVAERVVGLWCTYLRGCASFGVLYCILLAYFGRSESIGRAAWETLSANMPSCDVVAHEDGAHVPFSLVLVCMVETMTSCRALLLPVVFALPTWRRFTII